MTYTTFLQKLRRAVKKFRVQVLDNGWIRGQRKGSRKYSMMYCPIDMVAGRCGAYSTSKIRSRDTIIGAADDEDVYGARGQKVRRDLMRACGLEGNL